MTAPGDFSIGSDTWPGIAKLIEEAGEVIQVCGKLIAINGAENYDHWDGTNLADRLIEELGDLKAAVSFVIGVNKLDDDRIMARTREKLRLFLDWHKGQA